MYKSFEKDSGIMIRIKAQLSKTIAVLSASLVFCATSSASIVFDNTQNSLNRFFSPGNNVEFGDQIFLQGSERRVTDFSFEYFLGETASGNETGQIFFYANDGGANGTEPGSLLYSSEPFALQPGFQTVLAQALSVTVPNTFTWTVRFSGISFVEEVGLLLFNPPTVGASFDDFWVKVDDAWTTFLIDNGSTPANFNAQVRAVPEPSTYALALIGGVALLGYRRMKRRS